MRKSGGNCIRDILLLLSTLLLQGCSANIPNKLGAPEIIIDIQNYEYKWEESEGHKYADTTGTATLILDKKGNLYYFGEESSVPVIIMQNVKAFSMDDESDTLGYTAPIAVILTNDGELYACGDVGYGTIRAVSVLSEIPRDGKISFLEPILINKDVKDCRVICREIDYLTQDDDLYRTPYNYLIRDIEIENPTPASEIEGIDDCLVEYRNNNFVLSNTVQMGCARSFFVSVLEDGSVWTCFLPDSGEDKKYAVGYGEVMGDGSSELVPEKPIQILPPGTCF